MSEKATLLTSIPPVGKSAPAKPTPAKPAPVQSAPTNSQSLLTSQGTATDVVEATTAVGVAEDVTSEAGRTITAFQGAIYVSFVLSFCLAGFAAVALFRKATKISEGRFVVGAKALALAAGGIALHGFFATYLYANYLKGEGATVPLVVTIAIWALVGPAIAVVLNYLLTPRSAPEKSAIIFDACAYFIIFASAAIALIPGIKENASLLFSLLAVFLFIVPVARSFAAFRKAKARHPELREISEQVLIYSLLILPALLPVVVFAHACRMGDELTLFLFNFITFDFLLVTGLTMLASADDVSSSTEEEGEEAEKVAVKPAASAVVEKAPVAQPKPAVVEFQAPRPPKSKKLPPRKPAKAASAPIPSAPRKPGSSASSSSSAPEAANAPTRVKAPAKPKKRF
jgi:hypothetical protein